MNINKSAIIISILLVITMMFYFIAFVNDYDNLVGFILLVTLLLIFLLSIKNKEKSIKNILIIGLFLRLVLLIITNYSGSDGDWDGYGKMAERLASMDIVSYFKNIQTGAFLYSWLIAGIWKIIGRSYMAIRVINMFISYLCCVLGYKLCLNITENKEISKKALLFITLFPNLIRFSVPFANREPIFIFSLLLSINSLFNYYKNKKIISVISFFIMTMIGTILHISAAFLIIGFLLILKNNANKKSDILKLIFIIGIAVFVVLFMYNNNIGTEKLYLNSGGVDAEKLAWIQEASAEGRAAYLQGFSSNNIFITILQLPIRMLYFLYTPFIWMIRKPIDLLGLLDAILYVYITIKILKNRKKIKHDNKFLYYLLISILGMIIAFSIGTSNYGTAIRHRAKLIIPLTIIASPYMIKKGE